MNNHHKRNSSTNIVWNSCVEDILSQIFILKYTGNGVAFPLLINKLYLPCIRTDLVRRI